MENQNTVEENISPLTMDTNTEKSIKNRSKKYKDDFHEKECKVIRYNKVKKTLDVQFDKYGIRIKDIEGFHGNSVVVKYKGEIGKPNFKASL